MAQRRMFSLKVVDTDAFLEMPLSAQALYFHLGMRADDDGFISNPRRVKQTVGASDDDLKLLLLKRFLLAFDSGVVVVKHWRINNYVKGDRYTPTLYQEEKGTLFVKGNGVYTDHPPLPAPAAGVGKLPASSPADLEIPAEPEWNQNGTKMDTQVRVGEESIGKGSLGEERIDKDSFSGGGGDIACAHADVAEYLSCRAREPSDYYGYTQRLYEDASLLALSIFKKFTNRQPTQFDIDNVFFAVFRTTGKGPEAVGRIDDDAKKMLMYAFEAATGAGHPGEWPYIGGVLAKTNRRGINTLDQADEYDFNREKGSNA